jgi:hypothetical protein
LGQRSHDIWLLRVDEAAPFDQASAHRVDYEGSLNTRMLGKGDLILALDYMLRGTVFTLLHRPLFGALWWSIRDTEARHNRPGPIPADSSSIEDLPSLPLHLALQVTVDQSSVLHEYSIMRTKSAALPHDLNRARFVGPKLRKLEDWICIRPLQ